MGFYKVFILVVVFVRIFRVFVNWWNSLVEKLIIYLYIFIYYIFGIYILCWINF